MRLRDYLKRKAVKTGSKQLHDAYKKTSNYLNRIIKNTNATYFMNTLNKCENNPKEMWKTINKLTNKNSKTTLISEIQQGNEVLTTKHEIAEALNVHFGEVGPGLAGGIPHGNRTPESYLIFSNKQFFMRNVSQASVYILLSTIKTSKSAGHDGIPAKLLKDAAEEITPSLTAIFNASINTGFFPNDFKIATISPIHKSESKSICDNYRPISVLSCVAKIFEKLITTQIEAYLESNGLLVDEQSGFRKKCSK